MYSSIAINLNEDPNCMCLFFLSNIVVTGNSYRPYGNSIVAIQVFHMCFSSDLYKISRLFNCSFSLLSKNSDRNLFSAGGWCFDSIRLAGSTGFYWSSVWYSLDDVWIMYGDSSNTQMNYNTMYFGKSIRPIH